MSSSLFLNATARLISAVASPFIVTPLFSLAVMAVYASRLSEFWLWAVPFIVLACFLPFGYIYYGVRRGWLTDLHLMKREQRQEPFAVSLLGSVLLVGSYLVLGVPNAILLLAVILLVNGIVFSVITYYWKISIHLASLAGAIALVSLFISPKLAWLFLLLPFVIWARIRRNRHTLAQTVAASILVVVLTYLCYRLLS